MTKKTIAAVAAGLTLVAGQVAAQSAGAPVQDRLGSEESGPPPGAQLAGLPFAILFVAGFAGLMAASHDDDSDSD